MNMHLRYFYSFFLILFFSVNTLFAQQTLVDSHPLQLFKTGVELFESQHFASAQKIFTQYLNARDNNSNLRAEANYYIALSAMELFQDDAEILLTQFTQNFPEHPKARMVNYYLGKFQYRQKNYDKTIAALEKTDPSDLSQKEQSEYKFMLGYSYFKNNDNKKAKEQFAQIKDVPNDNQSMAAYYYGFISYQEGKYNEALNEFQKIKTDKKFKSMIPLYITQIYLLQGKYDKVISEGEAALNAKGDEKAEKSDEIMLYVAEAYYLQKNFTSAMELYDAYSKKGSLPEHHLYQYGYTLYVAQRYADAIKAFNKIRIEEDSVGQNISYHLAGAYVKTNDKIKARNSYNFASKLKFIPSVQELSLLNFAKISYDLNFQGEAIDALKLFLKNYPKSTSTNEAKELLSQILLASNNPNEALSVIESIPNRSGKLDEAYQKILYLYGLELFGNKQYSEAEDQFRKSIGQPNDKRIKALCYFWIAESQYKQSEISTALINYKNFIGMSEARQTPYYALAFYNLGYCYFEEEDYVQSKNYFKQYQDAENNNNKNNRYTDATVRIADCNFAVKNYAASISGYEQIIAARTQEADYATYQKGIIQGLQGNTEDKITTLRSLTKSFPNSPYIDDALYGIGESYLNSGNFTQAIKEFQSLNYNYPKNQYYRAALLNTGLAYQAIDQDDKGVAVFKTVVNKYPSSIEAKQALKFIQNSYIDRGLTDSLDRFYAENPNNKLQGNSQDSLLYTSAFNNYKKNDCNAAISAFEKYISKYPNGYFMVDANFYLAECEYKSGMNARAGQHYNVVINRSPNAHMEKALMNSAQLYFKDKDYTMALKRFEQLEEIANNKQNVFIALLGQLRSQFLLNNYEKTVEAGNKVLNLGFADDESKIEAQLYIAKSHLSLNQLELALANFSAVQKASKAEAGAEAMYNVAYIQYLQEKYDDAQNTIFDLKDKYAFYDYWKAKGFILLSDVFVKLGDDFQAKNTLQSIIDKYTGKDEIKTTAQDKLNIILAREKKNKQ
ncbi:MAG: tetratricopeptide repeat protein [Sphingobacteriales bacterium]|nr:MAG: tetratricopeptide repeat protein [Sphingobacteriales bacterium]